MIRMTWPMYRRGECLFHGRLVRMSPQLADLLATLLLRRGEPMTEEDLIEALWPDPDREGDCSDVHVRVLICRLRKLVPGIIQTHGWKSGNGWMISTTHDLRAAA